eukprot:SAG31_NODE_14326_length_813_cov_1.505602_1_plen_197_part_00
MLDTHDRPDGCRSARRGAAAAAAAAAAARTQSRSKISAAARVLDRRLLLLSDLLSRGLHPDHREAESQPGLRRAALHVVAAAPRREGQPVCRKCCCCSSRCLWLPWRRGLPQQVLPTALLQQQHRPAQRTDHVPLVSAPERCVAGARVTSAAETQAVVSHAWTRRRNATLFLRRRNALTATSHGSVSQTRFRLPTS